MSVNNNIDAKYGVYLFLNILYWYFDANREKAGLNSQKMTGLKYFAQKTGNSFIPVFINFMALYLFVIQN